MKFNVMDSRTGEVRQSEFKEDLKRTLLRIKYVAKGFKVEKEEDLSYYFENHNDPDSDNESYASFKLFAEKVKTFF